MTGVAVISVAPGTFLAVIVAAALAGATAAALSGRGLVIPVVVIELVFGVILGPQVIGLHVHSFLRFFSDLGLALLFFFAGYEIDIHRISGQPLRLGLTEGSARQYLKRIFAKTGTRRQPDLERRFLRSGDESHLLGHRQSKSGLECRSTSARRQPLLG